MVSQMPEALTKTVGFDAITTGAGYAQSTLYGLLGFVLITIASISWGSSAVAGAEENGRLELTLAHSVSRSGYYLNMLLALLVRTAAMAGLGVDAPFLALPLGLRKFTPHPRLGRDRHPLFSSAGRSGSSSGAAGFQAS